MKLYTFKNGKIDTKNQSPNLGLEFFESRNFLSPNVLKWSLSSVFLIVDYNTEELTSLSQS